MQNKYLKKNNYCFRNNYNVYEYFTLNESLGIEYYFNTIIIT